MATLGEKRWKLKFRSDIPNGLCATKKLAHILYLLSHFPPRS